MGMARKHKRALHAIVNLLISSCTSIVLLSGTVGADVASDKTSYTEDLILQRLGPHHVAARFVFRSTWVPQDKHRCQEHENWSNEEAMEAQAQNNITGQLCHFEAVFPRAVGVLLDRFQVRHLNLRMSKGKWDTAAWGNGPGDGGEYTAGGAEMWARLPREGAWESWIGLRRSLSGLYCSSLDGMDDSRVHTPAVMTLPGDTAQPSNDTTVLRGTLPREPVCTENLIPVIKMLPCRSKAGLASLLHPTRLFQSDYHAVSVRATASFLGSAENGSNGEGSITSLTLEQTVLAAFRPRPYLFPAVRGSHRANRGVGNGAGQGHSGGDGFSISSLLLPPKLAEDEAKPGGLTLRGCPIATRSAIHVRGGVNGDRSRATCLASIPTTECDALQEASSLDSGSSGVTRRLASSPSHQGTLDDEDGALESLSFFLKKKLWDINGGGAVAPTRAEKVAAVNTLEVQAPEEAVPASPASAWVENFLAGRGGNRGVSVSYLVNMHPDEGAYTEFMQPVPYFMVPMVGSLRARLIPSCFPPHSVHLTSAGVGAAMSRDDSLSWQGCGGEGQEGLPSEAVGPVLSLAQNLSFTPGEGRRPAIVEARLWVPAASTLVLSFDFFKRFLTVDEFPPDPSRGFDAPPPLAKFHFPHAVASSCPARGDEGGIGAAPTTCASGELGGASPGRVVYAYGEAGLMDAPLPDPSMPFNVITFTSTVITFFLGTAINLLVRKSARRGKGWSGRARTALRKVFELINWRRHRGADGSSSVPLEGSR